MSKIWTRDLDRDAVRQRPDWLTAGFAALIALGLLLAVAPAWLRNSSAGEIVAKKIHPAVFALLAPSIFYSGLILAALGILGHNLSSRSRGRLSTAGSFAVFALSIPLLAIRWWPALRVYARTSSTRSFADTILQGPERDLALYGYYYFRTGLPFYLRRPVGLVTSDGDELTSNYIISRWPTLARSTPSETYLSSTPLFIDGGEFSRLGRSSTTSFLVLVQNTEASDIAGLGPEAEPLWQAWRYSVWRISRDGSPTAPSAVTLSSLPVDKH